MSQESFQFVPVRQTPEENVEFIADPACQDTIYATMDYYKVVGFVPPWIGYYVRMNGLLMGCAAFKGKPVDNKVEIAYGTVPAVRKQGVGTEICRQLVLLALQTDPGVIITARTLPENNYSTKILARNDFHLLGEVWDKDDGTVWEWVYRSATPG